MDIEFNNAGTIDTDDSGWFLGFSEWAKTRLIGASDLRYMPQDQRAHGLCIKWMQHPARDPRGGVKPVSTGRTLSILVSEAGCFRLEFSAHENFAQAQVDRYTLQNHGDFVVWGAGLYHRWRVDKACAILTLRWIPDDQLGV